MHPRNLISSAALFVALCAATFTVDVVEPGGVSYGAACEEERGTCGGPFAIGASSWLALCKPIASDYGCMAIGARVENARANLTDPLEFAHRACVVRRSLLTYGCIGANVTTSTISDYFQIDQPDVCLLVASSSPVSMSVVVRTYLSGCGCASYPVADVMTCVTSNPCALVPQAQFDAACADQGSWCACQHGYGAVSNHSISAAEMYTVGHPGMCTKRPAAWIARDYYASQCGRECYVRTWNVLCINSSGYQVPDAGCSDECKPSLYYPCQRGDGLCGSPIWSSGPWGPCTGGRSIRTVRCLSSSLWGSPQVADSNCSYAPKPDASASCDASGRSASGTADDSFASESATAASWPLVRMAALMLV